MSGKLFFGGVPTGPNVDALMKLDCTLGTSISYEDISAIILTDPKSHRFLTVTNAYRKRLFRERLIQTKAEGGAIHFLTADQADTRGRDNVTRIGRKSRRTAIEVDSITPAELSSDERRASHMLLKRETMAIFDAVQKSAKALAVPRPVSGSGLRLAK